MPAYGVTPGRWSGRHFFLWSCVICSDVRGVLENWPSDPKQGCGQNQRPPPSYEEPQPEQPRPGGGRGRRLMKLCEVPLRDAPVTCPESPISWDRRVSTAVWVLFERNKAPFDGFSPSGILLGARLQPELLGFRSPVVVYPPVGFHSKLPRLLGKDWPPPPMWTNMFYV